ncbi:MAG: hypothetical protein U5L45_07805 [Saprospiraceae bacterium]|nr:hypothetical protein [Saprospiraceae bacterium]
MVRFSGKARKTNHLTFFLRAKRAKVYSHVLVYEKKYHRLHLIADCHLQPHRFYGSFSSYSLRMAAIGAGGIGEGSRNGFDKIRFFKGRI